MRIVRIAAMIGIAAAVPATAFAGCVGTYAYSSCTDSSGNNYNVSRIGGSTFVQGTSANGNSWDETSSTFGNQTYTTGHGANGQSWNETQMQYGNGYSSVYGTDAQGQSYSYNCAPYAGCQ